MATPFTFETDSRNQNSFGLPITGTSVDAVLSADTDTTFTVPADSVEALFVATGDFYISNSAITLPSASSFTAGALTLNPVLKPVTAGQVIHVRAPESIRVNVQFYNKYKAS